MADLASKLDVIVEQVESARAMPLSSSCVVNRSELLEELAELRSLLPQEVAAAREVIDGRDDVLADARREAESIIEEARAERARLVARLASGEAPLVPLPLSRGDVMIRDVRHIHRGTANRTAVPQPMMVVGYQRHWFHRPDVWLDVPRDVWPALPEQTRHRLRCARIQDAATSMEERTIMPPGVRAP